MSYIKNLRSCRSCTTLKPNRMINHNERINISKTVACHICVLGQNKLTKISIFIVSFLLTELCLSRNVVSTLKQWKTNNFLGLSKFPAFYWNRGSAMSEHRNDNSICIGVTISSQGRTRNSVHVGLILISAYWTVTRASKMWKEQF